ncbi:unnamed protein product [Heligmosomoides polygyrus]|uniref:Laminin EGF-like domain-containing protein n=1 Tax=Heligmosomoides polygyrus TaxID=6339 RepID=A0A183FGH9_HELPZ|nr:unnamed protein product [Heligmosomoides polygyrus]
MQCGGRDEEGSMARYYSHERTCESSTSKFPHCRQTNGVMGNTCKYCVHCDFKHQEMNIQGEGTHPERYENDIEFEFGMIVAST